MLEIDEHDSTIKSFFKNSYVNKVLQNSLPSDNARNLVSHLLFSSWSASEPIQNKNIAKVLRTNETTISERIKPDINAALKRFCDRYHILPPIQLYSRTRKSNVRKDPKLKGYSNIGMHFACSATTDKNTSGSFISIKELNEMLAEAKKRIQVAAETALQEGEIEGIKYSADIYLEEFRTKLKDNALQHLRKKLSLDENPDKSIKDYRPLELEIGRIEELDRKVQRLVNSPYDHNRKWNHFDSERLYNLQGVYILSSETGSGKTTFLRNHQLKIINKSNLIPLFLEASVLKEKAEFANHNENNFLESIGKLFNGYLQGGHEYEFLKENKDNIIYLIDGLDQIDGEGTAYRYFIDGLTEIVKNKMIIASRPFAVIEKEQDANIQFIRLKCFSKETQEEYFSNSYKRALELCKACPEMLSIPMLAYMVRYLIEKGNDKYIKNRKDLYSKFINHILINHRSRNLNLSYDEVFEIVNILGKISYEAIASKEIYLQRIPYRFAKISLNQGDFNTEIKIETLLKTGLLSTIINCSGDNIKYLYFSHQSFQEYLAAEYVSQSNELAQKVLSEKWNPKWNQVLKFLVGIKGQGVIENILSEKDNVICSKLFLATELALEVDVDVKLKKQLWLKIEEALSTKNNFLCRDILMHWILIEQNNKMFVERIVNSLSDNDKEIVVNAIDMLAPIGDKVDDITFSKLVELLENENENIVLSAITTLIKLKDKLNIEVARRIIERLYEINSSALVFNIIEGLEEHIDDATTSLIIKKLDEDDYVVVSLTIDTLVKLKAVDKQIVWKILKRLDDEDWKYHRRVSRIFEQLKDWVDDRILSRIVEKMDDENTSVASLAINILGRLNGKVDDKIFNKIANKLENQDEIIVSSTIEAIGRFKEKVNDNVFSKIVKRLDSKKESILVSTIEALGKFNNKVNSVIVRKIAMKLDGGSPTIRLSAVRSLGMLTNKVDGEIYNKMTEMMDDEDVNVSSSAIESIAELKEKVDEKTIAKLVEKLGNKNKRISSSAAESLRKLKDKLDNTVIRKITEYENDDAHFVLKLLYQEGKLNFLDGLI